MPVSIAGALVGSRNLLPDRLITDSGGTYRLKQVARIAVSGLQLHFANWYANTAGTGDVNGPNSYTIGACYLEHAGTLAQVLFPGSATSVSVPAGGDVQGTVTRTIAAGDTYYIRSYVTPDTGGGSYPGLNGVVDYPVELHVKASDQANATGDLTQYGSFFGPCMVTGTQTGGSRYGVAVVGDSLAEGIADDFSAVDHVGYLYRALNGNRPFLIFAVSGEQGAEYVAQGAHRSLYIGPGAQYLICEYGINDLQGGRTLAQTQASMLSIWSAAVGRNAALRVYQTTITPKSSSTDGWTTTANQTADGAVEPIRPILNAWIRAGAPISGGGAVAVGTPGALLAGQPGHPLYGYLEIADLAESARDSGKWRVDGGAHTDDGIHPNVTGHLALIPGVSMTALAHVPLATATSSAPLVSALRRRLRLLAR